MSSAVPWFWRWIPNAGYVAPRTGDTLLVPVSPIVRMRSTVPAEECTTSCSSLSQRTLSIRSRLRCSARSVHRLHLREALQAVLRRSQAARVARRRTLSTWVDREGARAGLKATIDCPWPEDI